MQRLIKFRAWDSNERFFHTPMTIEQMLEICCLPSDSIGLMAVKFKITRSSLIFQQFTGLLDKNGKEIWEGDILRVDNNYDKYGWASGELCHVLYNPLTARFIMKSKLVGSWSFEGIPAMQQDGVEVLGNIYEYPDLLK